MKTTIKLATAAVLLASTLTASDKAWWKASLVTMTAANAADVVTSIQDNSRPNLRECNPLYGSHFTGRDVILKSGIVAGQALVQYLIVRKHPKAARYFAVLNAGQTGSIAYVAARNASLPR